MKTGIEDLDKIVSISPGDVIVIGGRPSMGKTALMRQMALEWARAGSIVTYWDLQRAKMEREIGMLCSCAQVDRSKLKVATPIDCDLMKTIFDGQETGECLIDGMEVQRLVGAGHEMDTLPIIINPEGYGDDVATWLRFGEMPGVLFIDFIQLAVAHENQAIEIANMLTRLKRLAIQKGIVIFLAAQISRKVDEVVGHRPRLTHLSDSSSLEEVADKVIFILRRDHYDPNDKPGLCELIVAKNNIGNAGSAMVCFNKEVGALLTYQPYDHELDSTFGDDSAFR